MNVPMAWVVKHHTNVWMCNLSETHWLLTFKKYGCNQSYKTKKQHNHDDDQSAREVISDYWLIGKEMCTRVHARVCDRSARVCE